MLQLSHPLLLPQQSNPLLTTITRPADATLTSLQRRRLLAGWATDPAHCLDARLGSRFMTSSGCATSALPSNIHSMPSVLERRKFRGGLSAGLSGSSSAEMYARAAAATHSLSCSPLYPLNVP